MTQLANCLSTHTPKKIHLPGEAAGSADPIAWALDMFRTHSQHATLQMMKWARDGGLPPAPDQAPILPASESLKAQWGAFCVLDAHDPAAVSTFVSGLKNGQPVHGRLELFSLAADKFRHWSNVAWAFEFFARHFAAEMRLRHPLGFHAASTLWLSADKNVYPAHLDLQDGFLLHLAGKKHIKVWPTPEKYLHQAIFNHEDIEGRMASDPVEFDPQIGEVVFIPGGAVHQVNAAGREPVVSVSFHMGSPYPLLGLCCEINRLFGEECVYLPGHMRSSNKDSAYFFQPSGYVDRGFTRTDAIPDRLANDLLAVLESTRADRNQLRDLLSRWWQATSSTLSYQTPYPAQWAGMNVV